MSVAIFIKTLGREACLWNTLDSIQTFCNVSYRLYIADDGPISPYKEERYGSLVAQGHEILLLEGRTSVNAARNALAARLRDEPAVLRIDDDFEFVGQTDVAAMKAILDADPALGAIADTEIQCGDGKGLLDGQLSPHQGFFEIRDRVLYKSSLPVEDWPWRSVAGFRYAYCDHTRNFLLIRRDCIESCPWDERIFFRREHADFMMSIAAAGWRLGFTPDSVHKHRDDLSQRFSEQQYQAQKKEAHLPTTSDDVFFEKWFIQKITPVMDREVIRRMADAAQSQPHQLLRSRLESELVRRSNEA